MPDSLLIAALSVVAVAVYIITLFRSRSRRRTSSNLCHAYRQDMQKVHSDFARHAPACLRAVDALIAEKSEAESREILHRELRVMNIVSLADPRDAVYRAMIVQALADVPAWQYLASERSVLRMTSYNG